jgi:hypothetical protein
MGRFYFMEIWKDIPNYEGLYQASNLGRIKSFLMNRELILKTPTGYLGYSYVNLKGKLFRVHRIIGNTFLKNEKNFREINHKDGNKTNNKVENLEWCTRSYNMKHAFKNGLAVGMKGEKHHKCKLTQIQAIKIKYEYKDMTHKEIAKKYNVAKSLISMIRTGQTWKHI